MTASTSTALVPVAPSFLDPERFAVVGFLAGYRGLTRDAYALDLCQFASWCIEHNLGLFEVHRVDIECFARDLEAQEEGMIEPNTRTGILRQRSGADPGRRCYPPTVDGRDPIVTPRFRLAHNLGVRWSRFSSAGPTEYAESGSGGYELVVSP